MNNVFGRDTTDLEKTVRVIYLPRLKGLRKEERSIVREDQSVAEMANEVLMRQPSSQPVAEAQPRVR